MSLYTVPQPRPLTRCPCTQYHNQEPLQDVFTYSTTTKDPYKMSLYTVLQPRTLTRCPCIQYHNQGSIQDVLVHSTTIKDAMCVPSSTNQARLRLRSSDSRQLLLPQTKTELGKRAFAYAEPRAWTSTTFTGFKSAL